MTHDVLNDLGVNPSLRKPRPTRVAQAVEVKHLAVMVGIDQKITLFSSEEFVNVVLRLFELL